MSPWKMRGSSNPRVALSRKLVSSQLRGRRAVISRPLCVSVLHHPHHFVGQIAALYLRHLVAWSSATQPTTPYRTGMEPPSFSLTSMESYAWIAMKAWTS